MNELTREDNQILGKTIVYAYDLGGNISSKTEYAYTTDPSPANPTRTYAYTYDAAWKDKLVNYDGKTLSYDAIGNLTGDGTYTYTWEEGRQLSGMSKYGQNIAFKYDDSGIRTSKTVNGVATQYHLVGDKVTYETNGTDNIYYTYDANDNLVSMNLNGTEYYYIRNGQNDIIGLFDSTGTQVVSYTYDTWGKLISTTGSLTSTVGVKNPYRYRGYRYDTETGLYYLQSRYYNPEMGRFVNADDTQFLQVTKGELLGHNLFAYCANNPVMNSDPSGYLHLGKHWWNTVKSVGWIIDGAITFIPVLFALSNALKAAKTAQAITKAINKMGKAELREGFKKLALQVAKATGWSIVKDLGTKIYDFVTTVLGTSLGDIIAKAVDYLDGKKDGYWFA